MTDEPAKVDVSTLDLAAENRSQFEQMFPGVVADGVLDAGRLGELLDIEVTAPADGRERFGLMWAGKREAVQSLLTPSSGTLIPDVETSVNFDMAENVFIEGDNLEVLKLLQKAYNDQVRFIYIDPPYNTGNDFVYNDNFSDGLRGYLDYTGQLDDEGNRTSTSVDLVGRHHSRWLSMMYPRLVLARNLLRQDGFIFISINDNEVSTLRGVCNEVFGEENFVEAFVWQSIFRPSNMSKRVRRNAEYILCYRRSMSEDFELLERLQDPQGEASLTQNNNAVRVLAFPADSLEIKLPDGVYSMGTRGEVELLDDLVVEDGRATGPFRISGRFKWSQEYLDSEIAKGVYLTIKTSTFIPYYRKDYQQTKLRPTKILPKDLVGDVLQANAEVAAAIGQGVFEYPKPTSLVRFLLKMVGVGRNELVLDFFAGSGTTAHAVLLENAEDEGRRRCISINLPERTDPESGAHKAGYATVAHVTRARIRAAMEASDRAEEQGIRALSLAESNFTNATVDTVQGELRLVPETLADQDFNLRSVAQEILIKEGVRLDATWEWTTACGVDVLTADGVAVVLSKELTDEVVKAAMEIELRVLVFLEDGFGGEDAVKANAFTQARNRGITMKTV